MYEALVRRRPAALYYGVNLALNQSARNLTVVSMPLIQQAISANSVVAQTSVALIPQDRAFKNFVRRISNKYVPLYILLDLHLPCPAVRYERKQLI